MAANFQRLQKPQAQKILEAIWPRDRRARPRSLERYRLASYAFRRRSAPTGDVISSHDLATIVIGRFGRIEKVDDTACSLLGYSRAELLQLHGTDRVLPEEWPVVAVSIDRMRQGTGRAASGVDRYKETPGGP